MHVKVEEKQTRATQMFEVSEVKVYRGEDGDQVIVDMIIDGEQKAIICRQNKHVIYVMNKDGRTIDVYRV